LTTPSPVACSYSAAAKRCLSCWRARRPHLPARRMDRRRCRAGDGQEPRVHEVAERNANGVVLAKASAMIWASVANEILPPFEAATGMSVGSGMKLLVRARPVFTPQHGFRLIVDAIDPDSYQCARPKPSALESCGRAARSAGPCPLPTTHARAGKTKD